MTRFLLLAAAVLSLSSCGEDGPAAGDETSPGGIAYTLLRMPGHDDVAIHMAWASDWAYRPETNKAAPAVGVQLILAGGAEGHPAGDAAERLADLGSGADLYLVATDHVVGELTFERGRAAETVAIANAHLRAPTLDRAWLERVREGTAAGVAEARAGPAHAGFDAVRWAVFGAQPFRNALSLDEPGTLDVLAREDVAAWHAETFTRAPEAIVVAGGVDAAEAGAAVDALLAGLPGTARDIARDVAPDYAARRILLHLPGARATTLSLVAPLPPTRRGGDMEDLILVHALGGGDQSVLFRAVRSGLRASYGFGTGTANYARDHRFLFLTGEVEAAKLAEAERVVREAYAAFRQAGPLASWRRARPRSRRVSPNCPITWPGSRWPSC